MRAASESTPPPSPTPRRRMDDRRSITAQALRALDVEIDVRRAELASLERSRDLLERATVEHPDQCDHWHPESPCAGVIHARWCRACGQTFRRCAEHGGLRAATHEADVHRGSHGEGWGHAESATDARRLRERTETVPMGGLQAPPTALPTRAQGQAPSRDQPAHAGTFLSAGSGVLRRRKDG